MTDPRDEATVRRLVDAEYPEIEAAMAAALTQARREGLEEAIATCERVRALEQERMVGIPTSGEYGVGAHHCIVAIRAKLKGSDESR